MTNTMLNFTGLNCEFPTRNGLDFENNQSDERPVYWPVSPLELIKKILKILQTNFP